MATGGHPGDAGGQAPRVRHGSTGLPGSSITGNAGFEAGGGSRGAVMKCEQGVRERGIPTPAPGPGGHSTAPAADLTQALLDRESGVMSEEREHGGRNSDDTSEDEKDETLDANLTAEVGPTRTSPLSSGMLVLDAQGSLHGDHPLLVRRDPHEGRPRVGARSAPGVRSHTIARRTGTP